MVSEASGGNPPTLCRSTPIDLSSRATLSHSLVARPFLPLPPFLGLPHRLRYLHPNPPSLFVSLSFSLTITVRSLLRLCFSFPRAALLACRFFSSPPLAFVVPYRRQSPSPVGTLPTRPSRSPYLFPHIRPAHPYKKLKSSVGATGGVSPFVSFYPLPIIPPLPLS